MRKIIAIFSMIVLLSLSYMSVAQEDQQSKWASANGHYQTGNYDDAILMYEELLGGNEHSEQLYYNLGNAYYKNNNLGKAILNYSKAFMLNPGNEDIQHNLAVANARAIDKIDVVKRPFFVRWAISVGRTMSSDAWAIISLVVLSITLGGVVLWLVSPTMRLRKVGFYTAFFAFVATIASFAYAQSSYIFLRSSQEAVVVNTAAPVKSAPDVTGQDLFLLHEGTKVTILGERMEWNEILLTDGNKGWILASAIEQIKFN